MVFAMSSAARTLRWRSVSLPSSRFSLSASEERNFRTRVRPQRRWLRRSSPTVIVSTSHGQFRTTSVTSILLTRTARFSDARARRTRFAWARACMCCGAGTTVEAADILTLLRVLEAYRGWSRTLPLRSIGALGVVGTKSSLLCSFRPLPCPGVTSGVRGNLGEGDAERQPTPPHWRPSRSLRARFSCSDSACPKMDKPKLPIAGEFRELRDHLGEDLERPVEVAALMGGHQAGP